MLISEVLTESTLDLLQKMLQIFSPSAIKNTGYAFTYSGIMSDVLSDSERDKLEQNLQAYAVKNDVTPEEAWHRMEEKLSDSEDYFGDLAKWVGEPSIDAQHIISFLEKNGFDDVEEFFNNTEISNAMNNPIFGNTRSIEDHKNDLLKKNKDQT